MDTSANMITTMGIISQDVYNEVQGKDYFQKGAELIANGTTYVVKDHTGESTLSGLKKEKGSELNF